MWSVSRNVKMVMWTHNFLHGIRENEIPEIRTIKETNRAERRRGSWKTEKLITFGYQEVLILIIIEKSLLKVRLRGKYSPNCRDRTNPGGS